jgi:hypothetical protein
MMRGEIEKPDSYTTGKEALYRIELGSFHYTRETKTKRKKKNIISGPEPQPW